MQINLWGKGLHLKNASIVCLFGFFLTSRIEGSSMLNVCKLFMGELIFILSNLYLVYVQLFKYSLFLRYSCILSNLFFKPQYFKDSLFLKYSCTLPNLFFKPNKPMKINYSKWALILIILLSKQCYLIP